MSGTIVINGVVLDDAGVARLASLGVAVSPGAYWYDSTSGALGRAQGPTLAFIAAGLPLGGPLDPDASSGCTSVLVNGRRLPPEDLAALEALVGCLGPGRFRLDARGDFGFEGGAPLLNLRRVARALGRGLRRDRDALHAGAFADADPPDPLGLSSSVDAGPFSPDDPFYGAVITLSV